MVATASSLKTPISPPGEKRKGVKVFPPFRQRNPSESPVEPVEENGERDGGSSSSDGEEVPLSNIPLAQRAKMNKATSTPASAKKKIVVRVKQSKADKEILEEMKNPKPSTSGPLMREMERIRRALSSKKNVSQTSRPFTRFTPRKRPLSSLASLKNSEGHENQNGDVGETEEVKRNGRVAVKRVMKKVVRKKRGSTTVADALTLTPGPTYDEKETENGNVEVEEDNHIPSTPNKIPQTPQREGPSLIVNANDASPADLEEYIIPKKIERLEDDRPARFVTESSEPILGENNNVLSSFPEEIGVDTPGKNINFNISQKIVEEVQEKKTIHLKKTLKIILEKTPSPNQTKTKATLFPNDLKQSENKKETNDISSPNLSVSNSHHNFNFPLPLPPSRRLLRTTRAMRKKTSEGDTSSDPGGDQTGETPSLRRSASEPPSLSDEELRRKQLFPSLLRRATLFKNVIRLQKIPELEVSKDVNDNDNTVKPGYQHRDAPCPSPAPSSPPVSKMRKTDEIELPQKRVTRSSTLKYEQLLDEKEITPSCFTCFVPLQQLKEEDVAKLFGLSKQEAKIYVPRDRGVSSAEVNSHSPTTSRNSYSTIISAEQNGCANRRSTRVRRPKIAEG